MKARTSIAGWTAVALCVACKHPYPEQEPPPEVALGEHEVVVPADGVAAVGITPLAANNNLDVALFGGRTFLAWRTAPSHFASPETKLLIASEAEDGWRYEGEIAMMTDLREPRFLVLGDRLFLYFAVLGTDPMKFEPQGARVVEYQGPGSWSAPEPLYPQGSTDDTFIPWRAKVLGGTAYVIGYTGGGGIYAETGIPLRVHLLKTGDGRTLEPVVPGRPVVHEGGGSETDFELLDDGSLVAVMRNEAGDPASGFGSKICRAEAADLATWTCAADKKKYDSPLVFRHGADVWLVGRRNLTESGNFDLERTDLSFEDQALYYLGDYSFNPKRCSLWKVDPEALAVSFVVDLPSRGDTCFASYIPKENGVVTIYNYSNELSGAADCASWPDDCADIDWFIGQGQPTVIYRVDATFRGAAP
jgi:hypothetical protein